MKNTPQNKMKDAPLKKEVKEVIENCRLDDLIVDREVHININGDQDDVGNYLPEREIDVIAKFSYRGKKVLLLFECENSLGTGARKEYKAYDADVKSMRERRESIRVVSSTDNTIQSRHFANVDIVKVCFVYGGRFAESALRTCRKEAARYGFIVWSNLALLYYRRISATLGRWTRYELFKDFALQLESETTFKIPVMKITQKGTDMFLGSIHPGQLLKIAYVVRRASDKTYAYQRLLNKDRINAIGEFISSKSPQAFLPSAVLAVFDSDPRVQDTLSYDCKKHELTVPMMYCSAWMIDGQHRAYGFLGTQYEEWSEEKFEPFDLPVIFFRKLNEVVQTQTFININYYQRKIKSDLLCDLTTLTRDLQHKFTWVSLLGLSLNQRNGSPLRDRVGVSELHGRRPVKFNSLVQYGLLETLLGYREKKQSYSGPLFTYAPFNKTASFELSENQRAFRRQEELLIRFLRGVRKNTVRDDEQIDPWRNTTDYALLKPTGINALFMILAKILAAHPNAEINFDKYLKPLASVSFERDYVAKKGGGWKGFRGFANTIIRKLNKGKRRSRLTLYGEKEKI